MHTPTNILLGLALAITGFASSQSITCAKCTFPSNVEAATALQRTSISQYCIAPSPEDKNEPNVFACFVASADQATFEIECGETGTADVGKAGFVVFDPAEKEAVQECLPSRRGSPPFV